MQLTLAIVDLLFLSFAIAIAKGGGGGGSSKGGKGGSGAGARVKVKEAAQEVEVVGEAVLERAPVVYLQEYEAQATTAFLSTTTIRTWTQFAHRQSSAGWLSLQKDAGTTPCLAFLLILPSPKPPIQSILINVSTSLISTRANPISLIFNSQLIVSRRRRQYSMKEGRWCVYRLWNYEYMEYDM